MRTLVVLAAVLAVTSAALAGPTLEAMKLTNRVPVIDGKVAGDRAWEGAAEATGFTLLGKPDTAATRATRAMCAHNDRNIYVAFVCDEPDMVSLVTKVTETDGQVYLDDCVEVFIAPFADRARYYHFVVNAAGVLRDEVGQDATWNSGARVAAAKGDQSWSAEIAIPLAALDLDHTVGTVWAANFCREQQPAGEVSSWAPCKSGFHEPASFGEITGVAPKIAPLVAGTLRGKINTLAVELAAIRGQANGYAVELSQARALSGACARFEESLTNAARDLARRRDEATVKSAGSAIDEAQAAVPELKARLAKLSLVQAAGRRGYVACTESTMTKVRPDRPYSGTPARAVSLSLARNESEAAQLVVVPLDRALRDVQVEVSDLKGPRKATLPASAIDVNLVGYVEVKQKSGRSPGEPGLYPDPLLPAEPVDVEKTRLQSWWITVNAPRNQPAGTYRGFVTIKPGNADQLRLPFSVRVWDFTLPVASRLRGSYGVGMGSVWPYYDIAPGPGIPSGWIAGAWTGADINGVPNYFGTIEYTIAFDYDDKRDGKRSLRVNVTKVKKGDVEWPRFCYYTPPLELEPDTDYEFSVWYKTGEKDPDGPSGYFGPAGSVAWPATSGQWQQATYSFNSGDKEGIRVYLKAERVGTYWFDRARLVRKDDALGGNLLPNPDFEQGDDTARDRIFDAYMLNAIKHRASPTSLVGPDISTDASGRVVMDWRRFDEKMRMYIDAGLNAFNVFWCQLPSGWGTVEAVEDEARIQRSMDLLQQTQAHLDEMGWTHLAYIYTIDEPGWQAFPQVKRAFELAHAAAPKLKTLLTYGYGASRPIEPGAPRYADLAGYVDIHVPHSDCYEPIYLKKRQEMGDEIWAYVCISAQRPYLNNWAIDYPGMDHRLLFWQLFDHDITGFLYWQITYWQVNPWKDTLTYPGGNGDGSLIYPGPEGPVNSVRFELNRDGTEDYDMLVMLRDAIAALDAKGIRVNEDALLNYPQLTKSWTEYSDNPRVLENLRERIGDRLEHYTRMLSR